MQTGLILGRAQHDGFCAPSTRARAVLCDRETRQAVTCVIVVSSLGGLVAQTPDFLLRMGFSILGLGLGGLGCRVFQTERDMRWSQCRVHVLKGLLGRRTGYRAAEPPGQTEVPCSEQNRVPRPQGSLGLRWFRRALPTTMVSNRPSRRSSIRPQACYFSPGSTVYRLGFRVQGLGFRVYDLVKDWRPPTSLLPRI